MDYVGVFILLSLLAGGLSMLVLKLHTRASDLIRIQAERISAEAGTLVKLSKQVRRQSVLSAKIAHEIELLKRDHELTVQNGERSRPYSQAIRLAEKGRKVEELMSACGLTRAEADLVMILHGGERKTAGDSAEAIRLVNG